MRIIRKIILTVVVITVICSFLAFNIQQTHAALGNPFGGLDIWTIPCTCAAGTLMWHFLVPFYNPSVPMAGALVTNPTSIIYSNYYLHPGAWGLGTYTPGGGAGCYFGFPPYCYYLFNYGMIIPPTGTSP